MTGKGGGVSFGATGIELGPVGGGVWKLGCCGVGNALPVAGTVGDLELAIVFVLGGEECAPLRGALTFSTQVSDVQI